jgi:hypothetical protein
MNSKIFILLTFLFVQSIGLEAQSVSIYELGRPITDYEDNFKNLLRNWTKKNITNIEDFEISDIHFVETLTSRGRYNHYRNFFSSDKPVNPSTKGSTSMDSKGTKIKEFYIEPGYAYTELYDTRGMTDSMRKILSDDFQMQARDLLSREFDMDTLQLFNYQYHKEYSDTTSSGFSKQVSSHTVTSLEPLSQNYIDIVLEGNKKVTDLPIKDAREFILENLIIERLTRQVAFTNTVKQGDRVYAIELTYLGNPYTNYILCSSESKKVVWDHFFMRIMPEQ